MHYSDKLRHFPKDRPPLGISAEKAAQRALILRQVEEYEARHGKVATSPIRPVARLKRLSKAQTRDAMRDMTFREQVAKRQRQWVKGQEITE